jgi:protein-tyrosine phosphatase
MIDLHCHVLPRVDDGPTNWEEAIALAHLLEAEGVTMVAATPHSYGNATPQGIAVLVRELQAHLQAEESAVTLILGTEILYGENVLQRLSKKELLCYGETKALLIETSAFIEPTALNEALTKLIHAGYRVVFAHPEKLNAVAEDPNVLIPLIRKGVLMQITASNLVGLHGQLKQRVCRTLLKHEMGHVIASDAHSANGTRIPAMSRAFDEATKILGPSASHLFHTVPEMIIKDQPIPAFHPRPVRQDELR